MKTYKEIKKELKKLNGFKNKIQNLVMPNHWTEEGVEQPNELSKANAIKICEEFYFEFGEPNSIAATKENGVFVSYKGKSDYSIIIEAYNDGTIGILVQDDNEEMFGYDYLCIEDFLDNKSIIDMMKNNIDFFYLNREGYHGKGI
jgi:hypothetical protein